MSASLRIVFATLGSFGDLHPFLAIGRRLQGRGHAVTIVTSALHRPYVEQAGLAWAPMRPEPVEADVKAGRYMHPRTGPEFIFRQWLSPAIAESREDLLRACQGADVLVSQALALAAPMVAAESGIRWLSCILQPFAMFSAYDPPRMPPVPFLRLDRPWARAVNQRILHYARIWTEAWVGPVLAARKACGIETGHPIYEGQHAPDGVLALFSPLLGRPQPDWPPQTRQTGALWYESGEALPEGLAEFLAAGEAPIVFTLGSAACFSGGDFFRASLRAAQRVGKRALFLTGLEAGHDLGPLPEGCARFDYAPYELVFPHACTIVHSGGIGTSMQALRAGRPQLVVPFAHDQPDNAARLQRLGVGLSLPRWRYGTSSATRALRRLLGTSAYATRAADLSAMVEKEDGVQAACDAIEAMGQGRARHAA